MGDGIFDTHIMAGHMAKAAIRTNNGFLWYFKSIDQWLSDYCYGSGKSTRAKVLKKVARQEFGRVFRELATPDRILEFEIFLSDENRV